MLNKLIYTISSILNRKEMLQIGCDSTNGLKYLHQGCKPPIVHRDIKCTKILLNFRQNWQILDCPELAFPTESSTHIPTAVVGTPGYLDLEFVASSNRRTAIRFSDLKQRSYWFPNNGSPEGYSSIYRHITMLLCPTLSKLQVELGFFWC